MSIRDNYDYVNRFESICENLQIAIATEEDDERKVLATFISYYAKVLYDTDYAPQIIGDLIKKIEYYRETDQFIFLKNDYVLKAISISVSNIDYAYQQLQKLIEEILTKKFVFSTYNDDIFIEVDTDYSDILKGTAPDFKVMRKISVKKHMSFEIDDNDFMYTYMHALGNMHYAKMNVALNFLPIGVT